MDSSRRHELEQNSLYQALSRLPAFAADYGAYILLGIAIVVAVYFYFSTRTTAALREREAEAIGIYSMGTTIENARGYRETVARFGSAVTPDEIVRELANLSADFEGYALLPATSERPGIRARALRLRGDFNWTLAGFEVLLPARAPSAATQSAATAPASLSVVDAEPYLAAAESAYQEVVSRFPQETSDVLVALFGMAAVAEQRGEFEAAGQHYDAILSRAEITDGVKALARQRKNLLDLLALNPRLAKPRPATLPTTLPATGPATLPTTQPQSEPEPTPANGPSTQPAPEAAGVGR
jgi:hypothetical protein